jgi:hypothetical protein
MPPHFVIAVPVAAVMVAVLMQLERVPPHRDEVGTSLGRTAPVGGINCASSRDEVALFQG